GIPFTIALPDSTSTSSPCASTLLHTPAGRDATASRAPCLSCPQPCGRQTTPWRISSLISTRATTLPALDVISAWPPRTTPPVRASSGLSSTVQGSLEVTSDGTLCIHELFERTWRRDTSTSPASRRDRRSRRGAMSPVMYGGVSSIFPDFVLSSPGRR